MIYNYIRDQEKSEALEMADFLPFAVEEKYIGDVSMTTAKIVCELRDKGMLPPNILKEFINISGLYESICQLNKEG